MGIPSGACPPRGRTHPGHTHRRTAAKREFRQNREAQRSLSAHAQRYPPDIRAFLGTPPLPIPSPKGGTAPSPLPSHGRGKFAPLGDGTFRFRTAHCLIRFLPSAHRGEKGQNGGFEGQAEGHGGSIDPPQARRTVGGKSAPSGGESRPQNHLFPSLSNSFANGRK